jgi:hypothetical protein
MRMLGEQVCCISVGTRTEARGVKKPLLKFSVYRLMPLPRLIPYGHVGIDARISSRKGRLMPYSIREASKSSERLKRLKRIRDRDDTISCKIWVSRVAVVVVVDQAHQQRVGGSGEGPRMDATRISYRLCWHPFLEMMSA